MPTFVPGLELNRAFYGEVVLPLLTRWPHAAARIGWGSDVLGFDNERSTDHGWGPSVQVFVEPPDVDAARAAIEGGLPEEFRGWPVRYGWDDEPVRHRVVVTPLGEWLLGQLGFDAAASAPEPLDWLLMPQQKLLEVTAGAVFHDDQGQLTRVRALLAWYPDDVWLWVLASQWHRIAQEEAFVGRAADVGDELGSRIVTARLARELMRLWFLFSRVYWPYTKWFGAAFARLPGSADLGAALSEAVVARDFPPREAALSRAYETVGTRHNELGITDPVDPGVRPFHLRPYKVLHADRFSDACLARVSDPRLTALPLVGSVDQVVDTTDVLSHGRRPRRLAGLYEP